MQDIIKRCPNCMAETSKEICPVCNYDMATPINPAVLKPGTVLENRYYIGNVIESNGEGVTYICHDSATDSVVRIREYFPLGLCERKEDGSVVENSGCEFDYNDCLMKFLDLSKKLFKNNEIPAILNVLDIFEANGTAYRVCQGANGISLREFLMRNGGLLRWDQARSLFAPLLTSLIKLHEVGLCHRGISPDTIIVEKDGKLRLTGFCISEERTARSNITAQLFPGFAAVEQYGVIGKQGSWTDVYGFAATLYRTLVGNPPQEASERVNEDNLTIPAKIMHELPQATLEMLANALQILPEDRTETFEEMRRGMVASGAAVASGGAAKTTAKKKKKNKNGKYGILAAILTGVLLVVIIVAVIFTSLGGNGGEESSSSNNGLTAMQSITSVSQVTGEDPTKRYYECPDFTGEYLAAMNEDITYTAVCEWTFEVVGTEYSSKYKPGQVISQNIAKDTAIEKGTKIGVVISVGTLDATMPDIDGFTKQEAIIELLKAGFNYDLINFVEYYDDTRPDGVVVGFEPLAGVKLNPYTTFVEIKINNLTRDDTPVYTSSGESSSEAEDTSSEASSTEEESDET